MLNKAVTPRVFLIGEHNKKAELNIGSLAIETRFEVESREGKDPFVAMVEEAVASE